jgi:hypothetical protein
MFVKLARRTAAGIFGVGIATRPFMLAGMASFAGLVIWLFIDSSPLTRRINRLNQLVATGKIYQPTDAERDALAKTVKWLGEAAGLSIARVAINEKFSSDNETGTFRVYVTLPDQIDVTGCPAYNAIYDPELDAILLDQSFIALSEWKQILAAPDGEWGLDIPLSVQNVPSINVFLRFVLLHEFGHRQLHRRATVWYLNEATARRREEEADQFALEKMQHAFATASKYGIEAIEEATGNLISYPVTADMPINDQVEASLVEMIKVMLAAQFALPSASATFAIGRSHPNVITRLINLMDTAARTYHSDSLLQTLTEYTQLQTRQVEFLAHRRPLEVRSQPPVTGLAWNGKEHGLIVRSATNLLYRIPGGALRGATAPGSTVELDRSLTIWSSPANDRKRKAIWITSDGSIVIPSARETVNKQGQTESWSPPNLVLQASDIGLADERVEIQGVASVAKPWPYCLIIAGVDDRRWLVSIHADGQAASMEMSSFLHAAQNLIGEQKIAIDLGSPSLGVNGVFFPIVAVKDQSTHFVGYALVDVARMEVQRLVLPMLLDSCVYSTTENPLIEPRFGLCQYAIRSDASGESIFQAQLVPQPPDDWKGETYPYGEKLEVWQLSTQAPPRLAASQPLALGSAKHDGISPEALEKIELSPRIRRSGVERTNAEAILINVEDDSLYAFILNGNSLDVIFPFGGSNLRIAEDETGNVYVAELNGYKIFRVPWAGKREGIPRWIEPIVTFLEDLVGHRS